MNTTLNSSVSISSPTNAELGLQGILAAPVDDDNDTAFVVSPKCAININFYTEIKNTLKTILW